MARIRTIKPEFWTHEDLSSLPEATHMLAAALLNHADDEGYFNAHPGLVRAACCPLREPSVSVHDSLNLLAGVGFIRLGKGQDGKRYGVVVKFDEHQRVNRPTPSKIRGLGIVWEDSSTTHTQLSESSPPERNREQGKEQGKEVPASLRSASSPAKPEDSAGALPGIPPADQPKPPNLAERVAQITDEATEAYNASDLVKPNGGVLATVRASVGREKRQTWVKRCLRTARAICRETYGSERVTPRFWVDYWAACAADDFHAGRKAGGRGHENWLPDFEFLTREDTMLKVFERAEAAGEDVA